MPERFRIVHFAATDHGGLGNSALRIHKGLFALNQDSSLLVKKQHVRASGLFEIDVDLPQDARELATTFDIFQRWYLDFNRTARSNSHFSLSDAGLALTDHPLVEEAEILHLHSVARFLSPAATGQLAKLGKPIVWTLHDHRAFTGGCHFPSGCAKFSATCAECPQLDWDPYFLTEAQLSDALEMIPARRITCVSPTKFLANKARESALFRNSRIEVIPYGIDTETFQVKWKPQAKNHLGLDTNAIHLLFAANQLGETRKGFEHLARAIQFCLTRPRFKERAEKGQIALISLGHPHPSLSTLGIPYVSLGHLDKPEEMSQLYGAADLFLLPSSEENLPNTLLEAMSCGTAAIAFSVGGVPEVLTHDETGKLVPAVDGTGFAFAIEELIEDENLRMRMAEACRKTIVEKFSQRLQAERYLELYRELMRGLPRIARKRDAYGFEAGNDFKVTELAPIGSRLKQICTDSLPSPLSKCLAALEQQIAASEVELRETRHYMEQQRHTIEDLQSQVADQRDTLRKQETTIFHQKEILNRGAVRMLRSLKLLNK
jgi:glycosyltransferase involved in cell wall biosynthesis